MAFQAGNTLSRLANHQNPKVFQNALKLSVQRAKAGTPQLQLIADKLADLAEEGHINAICAVADRLDGKPDQTQQTNLNVTHSFGVILEYLAEHREAARLVGAARTIEHEPAAVRNGHSGSKS